MTSERHVILSAAHRIPSDFHSACCQVTSTSPESVAYCVTPKHIFQQPILWQVPEMLRRSPRWYTCLATRHIPWENDASIPVAIEYHRIPIHEGRGRAAPHSWTACMKGQFRHRADVFQDRTAVQPSLVWIWPCSNNARDAFCESCKSMIRLDNDVLLCILKTFTAWPTHFFRSTSCCSLSVLQLLARTQWKLPWYVWLCFDRALLVLLEEWGCDSETNIL